MNGKRVFWAKIKALLLKIYGLLIRVRVVGWERIALPMRSGFIVAANHLTGADSIVIQIALKTRIFFLTWARWFHSRFVGFWMKNLCDTMPVVNAVCPDNVATLRKSIALLKQGATIGVYPEGELNRRGGIDHIHNGTAWLAVRAGVPVLPVYVSGLKLGPKPYSRPWLNEAWEGFFSVVGNLLNRNIVVVIGEPVFPPRQPPRSGKELKQEIERINQELVHQFQLLQSPSHRTHFPCAH
ncbi:MAG: lysophospholipid acyltransferase family protein [candidate division WOR-3 bacterium]